jgi:cytochrome c oxidase cbb3-type subunit 3
MLQPEEIKQVSAYVVSLTGVPHDATMVEPGKQIFADNCASCHGETGKGKRDMGAPNLTDAIWLYGSDKTVIVDGLWNGRGGVMPAWSARLDDSTIKALAVYVHTFGGGEK